MKTTSPVSESTVPSSAQSDPDIEKSPNNPPAAPDKVELDLGEEQHVRVRTNWYQFWIPRQVPSPPPPSLDDAKIIPIANASFLSKLTYTWITPIMILGYQRTLQVTDLWRMDESQSAAVLSARLDQAWTRRVEAAKAWNDRLEKGKIQPSLSMKLRWTLCGLIRRGHAFRNEVEAAERHWRSVSGRKSPSLAWSLNDVFGRGFWIGGVFKVVSDMSQLMAPLLVKALINFAKARGNATEGLEVPSTGRGIAMAIGLFCLVVMTSVCLHQFWWHSMSTGVLARASLLNSLYKRGVMLTGKSRTRFSNADLVSNISTDISRIDTAAQWFHPAWTAPIQVIVCLIILVVQLGPSALAGFLVFVIGAPVTERLMSHRLRIRKKSMKFTDQRCGVLLELLGAMRVVKYFSYEAPFLKRIYTVREQELKGIRLMHHAQSANTAFAYSTPVLAASLAFVTYTSVTSGFDPAIIFSSFSLFQLLRQPMAFLPRSLSAAVDASNAFERLSKVFAAEVMEEEAFFVNSELQFAVEVDHATFEWEVSSKPKEAEQSEKKISDSDLSHSIGDSPFQVRDLCMNIPRGILVAIIGRVGSGKSSLLQGLIGEMRKVSGRAEFGGRVAYCQQTAWIQNATLRENILFGKPFDEDRYWSVVERSCLLPDLAQLPDGDLTEIGERGINLSGGQKQRVNIARALYYDAEILLLDDPLSAVDAHVGKSLFHGAIAPLVREGKTVILVTHALHFLSGCDYIYAMDDGRIMEHGTFEQLVSGGGYSRLDILFGGVAQSQPEETKATSLDHVSKRSEATGQGKLVGRLIVKERRSTGAVKWEVYQSYFQAARGFITIPMLILATILMQGCQVANSYTLVLWQANSFHKPFSFYQAIYASLGIAQAIFTFFMGWVMDVLSGLVSRNLHHKSVVRILHAQMSFFDTTPAGRIMSVFGKDVDTVDNQLPTSMRLFILTMANVAGALILISVLEHYFIIVALFLFVGYRYFQTFYSASARELKRLDAMLRSLLFAHFSESLTGLPTIRSYREIPRFIQENAFYIDLENRALFLTVTNQRWLAIRLDMLGGLMVFCVALFAAVDISGISPAQIGLVLTYTTQLTQLCGQVTRQSAEVENYMNSVERVVHYSREDRIEQEAPHDIPGKRPLSTWPSKGAIMFKDVSMRYRPGLPLVLRDVNLAIRGGEKIGIVGRSGAGKSSLTYALLRIVEYTGTIDIDGVNIAELGLKDLRTKISIIPQDPTLFSGTVRSNLDPFSTYDDMTLWDALRRSSLIDDYHHPSPESSSADIVDSGSHNARITLDTVIETNGANLSVGQRSLLSLARALVKDAQIVVLDEATASVDYETDTKIQSTVLSQFHGRTLICIAHRLRTILSYDRIIVVDAGEIAEFDTPLNLYDQGGIFHSLCKKSTLSRKDIEFEQQLNKVTS